MLPSLPRALQGLIPTYFTMGEDCFTMGPFCVLLVALSTAYYLNLPAVECCGGVIALSGEGIDWIDDY